MTTKALSGNTATLLAGGQDAAIQRLATAEVYDLATGEFTPVGKMHDARTNLTATLLEGDRVLVAGGDRN